MSYVEVIDLFRKTPILYSYLYPVLLNMIDNKTSKDWTRKTAIKPIKDPALQHILSILMINKYVGMKVECIERVRNLYANTILGIYLKSNRPLSFYQFFRTSPRYNLGLDSVPVKNHSQPFTLNYWRGENQDYV